MPDLGSTVAIGSETWHNPVTVFGSPKIPTTSGLFNTGSTWVGGVAPGLNDIVQIKGGHTVTLDGATNLAKHIVVEDSGALDANTGFAASIGGLYSNGVVDLGTSGNRIAGTLTLRNHPLDLTNDPDELWNGLLFLSASSTTMWGPTRTITHIFIEDADSTDSTVTVIGDISSWQNGDLLFFHGCLDVDFATSLTGALGQEYRTIASISGQVVTLSSALTFNHHGRTSSDALFTQQPLVQNLTRGLIIKSEQGNPMLGVPGYCLITERAYMDMWYTEWPNFTRTTVPWAGTLGISSVSNQGGNCRIAFASAHGLSTNNIVRITGCSVSAYNVFHTVTSVVNSTTVDTNITFTSSASNGGWLTRSNFPRLRRHCMTWLNHIGPSGGMDGNNTRSNHIHGNSFWSDSTFKQYWGPTSFSSHFADVHGNEIHGFEGTGYMTFFGDESFNKLHGNRITLISGNGNREANIDNNLRGQAGNAVHLRGPNNYIEDNFVANSYSYSDQYNYAYIIHAEFIYFNGSARSTIPSGPTAAGETPATQVSMWHTPILRWRNNVAFACTRLFTAWHINHEMFNSGLPVLGDGGTIDSMTGVLFYGVATFMYQQRNVTYNNITLFGQNAHWTGADYHLPGTVIQNSHIYGGLTVQFALGDQEFSAYGWEPNGLHITSIADSGGKCLITTNGAHGRSIGQTVKLTSCSDTDYDYTFHLITDVPSATTMLTNVNFAGNSTGHWTLCFGNTTFDFIVRDTLVGSISMLPVDTSAAPVFVEAKAGIIAIFENVTFTNGVNIYASEYIAQPNRGAWTVKEYIKMTNCNGNIGDNFYVNTLHTIRPQEPEFGAPLAPRVGITGSLFAFTEQGDGFMVVGNESYSIGN